MKLKIEKYPGLSTGKNGRLHFSGADTVKLAEKFGTPLYVISEDVLRDSLRSTRDAFSSAYPDFMPVFATKAMSVKAILAIAAQEGFGMDVASPGELFGARSAGCPMSKTILHGNFKKPEELEYAISLGVSRIVLDSFEEIETLNRIAGKMKKKAAVLLRVNPGVEAHTFEPVKVGILDSKFGLPMETGDALRGVEMILGKKNLDFKGIHYHIGSQILEPEPFALSAIKAIDFMALAAKKLGAEIKELDAGGGYPVRYQTAHPLPPPAEFAKAICGAIKTECSKRGLKLPKLIIEPGRGIIGPAGITLYEIGPVKTIPKVRNYVSVDGGLSDNPRPVMYGSLYEVALASRPVPGAGSKKYRVCGRHCETDILFNDIILDNPKTGDILAVLTTGAYNHALSSNYNKFPRPAMVLVTKGKAELIMERETVRELYAHDVMPERLKKR